MAVRIKSHWHDEQTERSLEEIAGAIAFNGWKIALDKAIGLHGENYVYGTDRQRLDVIAEHLIFQVVLVDRLSHKDLGEEDRRTLVTALALKFGEHIQDNSIELLGPGDYVAPFIDRLNARSAEYSKTGFSDQGPSYPFYRQFGYEVQQVMGESQANRWVIDQIMDKDGPEVYRQIKRILRSLFL